MAGVRKVCVDCKRVGQASSKTKWCDRCGGELRTIPYGARKRSRARRR